MLDWIRWCQNISHSKHGSFPLALKNGKIFCISSGYEGINILTLFFFSFSNLLFESEGQEISVDNQISYIFYLNICSG